MANGNFGMNEEYLTSLEHLIIRLSVCCDRGRRDGIVLEMIKAFPLMVKEIKRLKDENKKLVHENYHLKEGDEY